jgi:lipid II:glycine glycyltransferase (peptidoglycan interpeptide bridge formation enzyme)
MSMNLNEINDQASWDAVVAASPWGHPLQLWGWGEAKSASGWTAHRFSLSRDDEVVGGAQILCWPIPRSPYRIAYIPRGPVVDPASPDRDELLESLAQWARQQKALYLRIEPAWQETKLPTPWLKAGNQIQLAETYTIDLGKTTDELLEPMARKTRQYIRKAERDGVTVERSTDIKPMIELYRETAARAGFGIHPEAYYDDLMKQLGDQNHLYYASVEGKPAAFLWLATAGETAYELYGGVNAPGQELKANYYLKWSAITAMKELGLTTYDFNGRLNDGVGQFKAGFAPDEVDYIGTYDYVFNRLGYQLWERLWPFAKPIGRRLRKAMKR